MDCFGSAQLTFGLGGFLGQDVALERRTTLDGSTRTHAKTFLRAALGFHFWHDNHCPLAGQLLFCMIAGGNISLRLDAYSHLLCSGIESTAIAALQKTGTLQISVLLLILPPAAPNRNYSA